MYILGIVSEAFSSVKYVSISRTSLKYWQSCPLSSSSIPSTNISTHSGNNFAFRTPPHWTQAPELASSTCDGIGGPLLMCIVSHCQTCGQKPGAPGSCPIGLSSTHCTGKLSPRRPLSGAPPHSPVSAVEKSTICAGPAVLLLLRICEVDACDLLIG